MMKETRGKRHFTERHYTESQNVTAPVNFLNPTTRYFTIQRRKTEPAVPEPGPSLRPAAAAPPPQAYHVWRSRDNRKGRHSVVIGPEYGLDGRNQTPEATNTWRGTWKGIRKMAVRFPVWDISYDVAVVFTLGSIVWCFNGFFVWLPLEAPSTEFPGEVSWGGGLTAFLGATIFEFGSLLLMLEAVNENRADCFGWALEEAWESGVLSLYSDSGRACRHHHTQKSSFLKPSTSTLSVGAEGQEDDRREHERVVGNVQQADREDGVANDVGAGGGGGGGSADRENEEARGRRRWSWWPSWCELRTHYFREIGFLACLSQFIGATIFWIAGITSLPPIQDIMSTRLSNGIFWLPQVRWNMAFLHPGFRSN
jgi:hypothetical protein